MSQSKFLEFLIILLIKTSPEKKHVKLIKATSLFLFFLKKNNENEK